MKLVFEAESGHGKYRSRTVGFESCDVMKAVILAILM
jgi:hypothetical protein